MIIAHQILIKYIAINIFTNNYYFLKTNTY